MLAVMPAIHDQTSLKFTVHSHYCLYSNGVAVELLISLSAFVTTSWGSYLRDKVTILQSGFLTLPVAQYVADKENKVNYLKVLDNKRFKVEAISRQLEQ